MATEANAASEEAMEAASKTVREVGLELSTIKNAMRKLTIDNANKVNEDNTFKVTAMKVSGLPESAQPRINLQLSSPIESKTITKIYDPLDDEEKKDDIDATADTSPATNSNDNKEKEGDDEEKVTEVVKEEDEIEADAKDTEEEKGKENAEEETPVEEKTEVEKETPEVVEEEGEEKEKTEVVEEEETPVIVEAEEEKTEVEKEAPAVVEKEKTEIETKKESSHVIFRGIDASTATLTVDLSDLDIPLGSSATYDLAPLCEIDVLGGVTKKITDLKVAIVPDETMTSFATAACFEDNVDVDTGADADAVIEENESESEDFQDAVSEEGEATDKADNGVKVEEVPTDDAAIATQDDDDTTGKNENGEKEEKVSSDPIDVEESAEEEETKEVVSEEAQQPEQVEETKKDASEEAPEETTEEIEKEKTTEQEETTETETETKEEAVEVEKTPSPEEGSSILLPTCVLDLKIEYNASTKDQTLILTEKYNAAVARHAVAVDKLRKIGVAVRRAKIAAAASSQLATTDNKKPAVKPGFLNKQPKKKEPMFYVRWYEKTLGPNSLFRKVYPIAKNYVLFFGGVLLMHFQGHQLALPPPV